MRVEVNGIHLQRRSDRPLHAMAGFLTQYIIRMWRLILDTATRKIQGWGLFRIHRILVSVVLFEIS